MWRKPCFCVRLSVSTRSGPVPRPLNHLSRYRNRWRLFSEMRATEDEDGPDFDASLAAREPDRGALDEVERQAALEVAMRHLPDHQRVPLVLFHFEDKPYQEIADLLGVSLGKIKTDIHRGREALRRHLVEMDHGPS